MVSETFRQSVFAAATDKVYLVLLKISHPMLTDDIRVVHNTKNVMFNGDEYIALPFDLTLPNSEFDAEPRARISIDNVGQELTAPLREIEGAVSATLYVGMAIDGDPITFTMEREYAGFELSSVEVDSISVAGDLSLTDLTTEAYPADSFVASSFRGILA